MPDIQLMGVSNRTNQKKTLGLNVGEWIRIWIWNQGNGFVFGFGVGQKHWNKIN